MKRMIRVESVSYFEIEVIDVFEKTHYAAVSSAGRRVVSATSERELRRNIEDLFDTAEYDSTSAQLVLL